MKFNYSAIAKILLSFMISCGVGHAAGDIATIVSADSIKTRANGQESVLKGNVRITIGQNIILSGNEMLVMYGAQHRITDCIIYGVGEYQRGNQTTHFKNGTFKVSTLRFSAERTNI